MMDHIKYVDKDKKERNNDINGGNKDPKSGQKSLKETRRARYNAFTIWYAKNKNKLAQLRKEKYRSNAEYREKIREDVRKTYLRRGLPLRRDRRIMYDRDGNCLYTIGYLAQVTGRAECTIRNYITAGVIPDAAYYDKRGWRLYTEREVKLVEEVFNSLLIGEITSLYQVSDELKKRWDDDKK